MRQRLRVSGLALSLGLALTGITGCQVGDEGVSAKTPALRFASVAGHSYGDAPFVVSVSTDSPAPVSYSVAQGPAVIDQTTVTITGLGTVVLRAEQQAGEGFTAASATTRFAVTRGAPNLQFSPISTHSFGDGAFSLVTTSASTAAVRFTLQSGPATLSGSTLAINGVGTVALRADQSATDHYAAATATTSFDVIPGSPGLLLQQIGPQSLGGAAPVVTAQSASNAPITYAVLSGPAVMAGSEMTLSGVGTVVVGASQPASGNYASAATQTSFVVQPPSGTTLVAASRLLEQASFGPTTASLAHVQSVGLEAYLAEQFAQPATLMPAIDAANLPPYCSAGNLTNCAETPWWTAVLSGPDQLRQRVAFALSEIFVVSTIQTSYLAIPQYQNVLLNDAFGNFRSLMKDVTLSPAMGVYLNLLNSAAARHGSIANENFARENMQLFTVGTSLLFADGTPQLDGSGHTIPAYTEAQVQAFARAYTGWTYAIAGGGSPSRFPNYATNFNAPLVPVESAHDTGAKALLNNLVLPGGQTAEEDLDGALDSLFNHPNVGPFICKQLIHHLVTSAPSSAYVARIAAVFADNGEGVRGDLKAVVQAILLDEEARAGDAQADLDGGHLREPILYWTALFRELGVTGTDPTGSHQQLSGIADSFGQRPFRPASVFGFFPANFALPEDGRSAPEFGLEDTAQVARRLSWADRVTANRLPSYTVDLSATSSLAVLAAHPAELVEALSVLMMHGQMPAQMKQVLLDEVNRTTALPQRARLAVYLVLSSPQYNVIH